MCLCCTYLGVLAACKPVVQVCWPPIGQEAVSLEETCSKRFPVWALNTVPTHSCSLAFPLKEQHIQLVHKHRMVQTEQDIHLLLPAFVPHKLLNAMWSNGLHCALIVTLNCYISTPSPPLHILYISLIIQTQFKSTNRFLDKLNQTSKMCNSGGYPGQV